MPIPRELLDTATIPGREGELQLYRHDRDFIIRVDNLDLMTSRVFGSEEMLAEMALERLSPARREKANVLTGGLGMGFTQAAVLRGIGKEGRAEVAELVPEVVEWNRKWFGEKNGHPLDDPRTVLTVGDVVSCIRGKHAVYDIILLDVDNSPDGLVLDTNDRLYSQNGLYSASKALRPGGVLGIWSASQCPWFTKRLQVVGFDVHERRVRARRTKGAWHTIWMATGEAHRPHGKA